MTGAEYLYLPAGSPTPPPLGGVRFRAVVVIEQAVDNDWRSAVSGWLVASGCLYMMAWGHECSAWDDSVDWASLEAHGFGDIPNEALVMTTWHEDETLSEVLWFAKQVAQHSDVELSRTVIVHVSDKPASERLLSAWRAA
jgi:hypothetical protein